MSRRRLRTLFVSEGDLDEVIGHITLQNMLQDAFGDGERGIDAHFVKLPPMSRADRVASGWVPGLGRLDLDLQPVRWHLVQAARARRVVREELQRQPYDVLHVNSHSIAFALGRVMGSVPTVLSADSSVWSWHELGVWRRPRPYSRAMLGPSIALERRALGRAKAVLAWTEWAGRQLLREAPNANIVVHNPGLDLTRFRPLPQPSQPQPPSVLFVGSRFSQKGGFDLIEAMRPLLEDGRAVIDVVTRDQLPTLPGLRVHRVEHHEERLVELYNRAEIFCLPTHADTMGWAILEAMACAKPVVSTPVAAIPELLDEGLAGVIVPLRDPRSLRTAVEALLGDPTRARELGGHARSRCEERYDLRTQSAELIHILQEAAGEPPLSAAPLAPRTSKQTAAEGLDQLSDDVQRPVARNLTSLWLSRGLGFAVQLAAFAVIAAHLGPASFGVYVFALAFAELFRIVPDFGFGPIVTRDISQHPDREAELLPNLLYLRTILGAIAYAALAVTLLVGGFGANERTAALVASLALMIQPLSSMRSALESRLKMGRMALVEIVRVFAFAAGAVILAAADADVLGFVWLYLLTTLGAELVVLTLALAVTKLRWGVRPSLWWPTARAAAPLAAAGLLIALYYRFDIVLLGALKPEEDVGQYGAAYRFLDAFAVLASLAALVLAPVWARSFVGRAGILQRRYRRVMRLALQVALPVGLTGSLTAWRLLPQIPGLGGFDGAGVALSILSSAAAFIFLASIAQGILISAHLQRRLLVIAAWGFAFNLALNLALIPPYSYIGAAIATSVTEGVVMVFSIRALRTRLGLVWLDRNLVRTVIPCTILTATLLVGFAIPVGAQIVAGVVAYGVAAVAVGMVTPDDMRAFVPELLRRRGANVDAGTPRV